MELQARAEQGQEEGRARPLCGQQWVGQGEATTGQVSQQAGLPLCSNKHLGSSDARQEVQELLPKLDTTA